MHCKSSYIKIATVGVGACFKIVVREGLSKGETLKEKGI